ncbi:5-oxoproline transporter, DUF969 family subunit [Phenylobacterium montanum]|uniref:DUF969 domain-containing protein n=1 Tax=Phenylobacterium montanum TaxID=2823693 RepID=A0A975FY20_9CAUL|nr:DUF969 family protein [Caulobacter sp. S6]QUD87400.1 DUF969 domain-containing protein [Caulobacter sp. S6]
MLTLIGVPIVVLGFVLRFNPLLVVTVAAVVTGLLGGMDLVAVISAFGKAFNDSRYVGVVLLALPAVGLLERAGLQERAKTLIGRARALTAGRLLLLYFVLRQATAAIGLTAIAGQAQMVRPLIAPMAEAAAEARLEDGGGLNEATRQQVRAEAAAAENVALFFGEDIFVAVASVLLIKGVLQQNGVEAQPLQISMWAIPTALCALLVHGFRLLRLDRRLARTARP